MSFFQKILIGFFVACILVGVIMFAGYKGKNNQTLGSVVIWGTFDNSVIETIFAERDDLKNVSYKKIDEGKFDFTLTEALASGNGPDIFIIPQSSILKHQNKIIPIPYSSFSARNFKEKFVEEGELYLKKEGVLGFPLVVDPLVMYWNRDIFSGAGISSPPKKWDEIFALTQKITQKDDNLNILKSTIPFGEFRNLNNAKEILSVLLMQSGNKIVFWNEESVPEVYFNSAGEAMNFFTQFSNPTKNVYTWNRALPSSEKSFLAGNLALYFGFASELPGLRAKNPNLNFDIAMMPQTENGSGITFGKMYGLVISKNSKNIADAFQVMQKITEKESLTLIVEKTNLPPATRDLLIKKPDDPYFEIFYNSAISSRAWLDPDQEKTNKIFQEMVESIVSGRNRVSESVDRTDSEIRMLLTGEN